MKLLTQSVLLATTLALFAANASGEEIKDESIKMVVGQQKAFQFSKISKISVGNPSVADVKIAGEDSFILFATGKGSTSMVIMREDKPVLRFAIVVTDNLKRVTVVLEHADGNALQQLLRPYLSEYGQVQYERRTRALTLVDKPDVVDIMLKMVKKFDVKPPQLQLSLKLVLAEKSTKPGQIPAELKPVARQLKEVFSYNRFEIMDKAFINVVANQESSLKVGGDKGYFADISTEVAQGQTPSVRLRFHLYKQDWIKHIDKGATRLKKTLIATTVEMKNGETAILGASKINGEGKALITIMSLKIK